MVTLLAYAFLAVIVLACLYWIATRIISHAEQISPPAPDVAPWHLAETQLQPEDVVDVRLPVSLRGYRFAETDLLLDRLTEELRLRDEQIARLQGHAPNGHVPDQSPAPDPDPLGSPTPADLSPATPVDAGRAHDEFGPPSAGPPIL